MMKFKQFMELLDSYLTGEDKDRLIGWDAVSEGFKEGGMTARSSSSTIKNYFPKPD